MKDLYSCSAFMSSLLLRSTWRWWMTIRLRMMAYSTRERKTSSMQASSQTSIAVTAFDIGIRVLRSNGNGTKLATLLRMEKILHSRPLQTDRYIVIL